MDQPRDESAYSTEETNEKIVFKGWSPNERKSLHSKSPIKKKSRTARMSRNDSEMRKSRRRGRLTSQEFNNFTVELLAEQLSTPQETCDKLWQTCFVNIEHLTPNKLDLVKTVSSPLLQIKNEMSGYSTKNIKTESHESIEMDNKCVEHDTLESHEGIKTENKCVEHDTMLDDDHQNESNSNDKCQDNDNTVVIEEKTLNDTFTVSPDDSIAVLEEHLFDTQTHRNEIEDVNSPTLFKSFVEDVTLRGNTQRKHGSIVRKLSKAMKDGKTQKLSSNSKVSKNVRLSTFTSSRTLKIPGSKAVQLYEFLTDEEREPKHSKDVGLTQSPPSSSSTPISLKKHVINSLLKSTLKKQKRSNVTFRDATKDEDNLNKSSRVKIPNFALIHKKQFEKMENISDYHRRKSERAKLLLSGGKVPEQTSNGTPKLKNESIKTELVNAFNKIPNMICESPNVSLHCSTSNLRQLATQQLTNSPNVSHRSTANVRQLATPQLQNSPNASLYRSTLNLRQLGTPQLQNSPNTSLYRSTLNLRQLATPQLPISRNVSHGCTSTLRQLATPQANSPWRGSIKGILKDANYNLEGDNVHSQDRKVKLTFAPDEDSDTSRTHVTMRKTPFKGNSTKYHFELETNQKSTFKDENTEIKPVIMKPNPPLFDIKKKVPSVKEVQQGSTSKPNTIKGKVLTKEKTGHTRFGFRVPVKAMAKKTKLITEPGNKEEKRAVIKGVRSNRRFDLLMQMRLKNK